MESASGNQRLSFNLFHLALFSSYFFISLFWSQSRHEHSCEKLLQKGSRLSYRSLDKQPIEPTLATGRTIIEEIKRTIHPVVSSS